MRRGWRSVARDELLSALHHSAAEGPRASAASPSGRPQALFSLLRRAPSGQSSGRPLGSPKRRQGSSGKERRPQSTMILTQCPVCAAPLPDLTAKQCSRCKTRYCGPACQKQHWEAGGHDKLCKLIKRGGGAEQYHADTKYTKVVAVAAEACADDTKGQTCYICTQAVPVSYTHLTLPTKA